MVLMIIFNSPKNFHYFFQSLKIFKQIMETLIFIQIHNKEIQ